MDLSVFAAVLLAAFLHASWNAVVKYTDDRLLGITAVILGHVPFACLAVLYAPLPKPASWPYILIGAVLHVGYQAFLFLSYRVGDLSHVYPIARGIAPMLVAGVSVLFLSVQLTNPETASILVISVGIISLVFVRGSQGLRNPQAATMAVITGCFIAAYSLVDGHGARQAETSLGFYGWLSIINAIVFVPIAVAIKPNIVSKLAQEGVGIAVVGGGASFVAYSLVVWAFTQAPIALVAALRETSIIFALFIGVCILRERLNLVKLVSTILTVAGAILLRASR